MYSKPVDRACGRRGRRCLLDSIQVLELYSCIVLYVRETSERPRRFRVILRPIPAMLSGLAPAMLSGLVLAMEPPKVPDAFSAHVVLDQSASSAFDPHQEYEYHYDWVKQREAFVYSVPRASTALYIYHGRGFPLDHCDDNNTCASIYSWGPGEPCMATNTSNTLARFWGWLRDDEFTHQKATFLRHDLSSGCDLWQHNSDPIYPKTTNQNACVAVGSAPVYMNWTQAQPNASGSLFENKAFTAFDPAHPPESIFQPPASCKWMPPAQLLALVRFRSLSHASEGVKRGQKGHSDAAAALNWGTA